MDLRFPRAKGWRQKKKRKIVEENFRKSIVWKRYRSLETAYPFNVNPLPWRANSVETIGRALFIQDETVMMQRSDHPLNYHTRCVRENFQSCNIYLPDNNEFRTRRKYRFRVSILSFFFFFFLLAILLRKRDLTLLFSRDETRNSYERTPI